MGQQMTRRFDFFVRLLALLVFAIAVICYSWNSDDAYHSYIMAKHLAEGKGFVYNVGFRVTASTCPLLTLVEAFVFLFTSSANVCGFLIGVSFSVAAAWILFFRLSSSAVVSFCLSGLMVASRSFLSFTTSGLENPMLFFFGAVFCYVYFLNSDLSWRHLLIISLLMSLIAMTRMDSVLIFIPMAVWAYLARSRVSFIMLIVLGAAGLSPFIVWICFSTIYYGFPFPNTYYAKLYTGIPVAEYIIRGLKYYPASWIVDPMMLLFPAFAVGIGIKMRNLTHIPLFIGLAAYCVYVVLIGGDFMAGRHLTQQYFLLLCSCALSLGGKVRNVNELMQSDTGKIMRLSVVTMLLVGCIWNYCARPMGTAWPVSNDVVDERYLYLCSGGEVPLYKSIWPFAGHGGNGAVKYRDTFLEERISREHEKGNKGFCFGVKKDERNRIFGIPVLFGKDIYAAMDREMYLTDVIALQDPLLSRLKVHLRGDWRVGHILREVPEGYVETLATGENRIEDSSLSMYYDKLLLVMKGPLFDRERLRTVAAFNCGKYDKLLEQYEKNRPVLEEDVSGSNLSDSVK